MKALKNILITLIIGLAFSTVTLASNGEEKRVSFQKEQTSLHIKYDNFVSTVRMTLLASEEGIIFTQDIPVGITENVIKYENLDAGEYIVLIEEDGNVIEHYTFEVSK